MKYRRVSHVAWRRMDDVVIVVDMRNKRVVALNETGGKIWTLLENPIEWSDLLRWLRREVQVDIEPHVLHRWLVAFMRELQAQGLVVAEDSPPEPHEPAIVSEPSVDAVARPRVEWVEPLHKFGQSCAFLPGQGGVCDANPGTS